MPQAGGLAVVLADAVKSGSLWFGWSGKCAPATATAATLQEAGGVTYATIDLGETDHRLFYTGFGNGALWPMLLFRLGLINFRPEEYAGYRAVNRAYARALAPLLQPDDLIWVHDYLLIPLAEELRALGVDNRIGFFLHTPFVPPAILSALPRAAELLGSLCAYDVVGFQTRGYLAAFKDCVTQVLNVEVPNIQSPNGQADETVCFSHGGRRVRAIVDPVGIDADAFSRVAQRAVGSPETRRLAASLDGRALAIGVDRLDYAKGLPNRVEAFGRLFEQHPEHRRQVSFLQVAAPSREDIGDYQSLRRQLDRLVGDVNGRYSDADWTPLRYMTRPLGRRTLAGFYRLARVGVVTPLRDGMNLVAKEFIAAQDPLDPGVLILSRFAGAADDMAGALIVNPFDADEVAEAMHAALSMREEERKARHEALHAQVRRTTANRFCEVFLAQLQRTPRHGGIGHPAFAAAAM
nr:trehalose-6-phosphate synthase [Limobrevibacterium gyesilva]